ncbi:hypothetical protein GW889_00315 [Candidatus Berkelbacteria bacterium]|nr:hypothetical protein [Candidatus Berkelbacteria bacterium]
MMELIILLFYVLFVIVYSAFYGYIIKRIWEFRIEGDKSRESIIVFLLCIGAVLIVSILIIMVQFARGVS